VKESEEGRGKKKLKIQGAGMNGTRRETYNKERKERDRKTYARRGAMYERTHIQRAREELYHGVTTTTRGI